MCGICGIIDFNNNISGKDSLTKSMADQLIHRGPDDEGYYQDKMVSLGFKRLSILDLKNGKQPVYSQDKSIISIFNGEIYNFKEIKEELKTLGYKFYTTSDSEIIVHAYHRWGIDCIKKFNGMFAISLYDKKKEKVYLVRDRLGIKPLYYYEYKNSLIFSSEIKPIINLPFFNRELNLKSLSSYLSFRYPTEEKETFFMGIKRLSPGSFIEKNINLMSEKNYWDFPHPISNEDLGENHYLEKLDYLLSSSVKKQLISDVPLGVFLSGGLDSSLLSAIASKNLSNKLTTYSVTLPESGYNESAKAKLVSKHLNTNHKEIILDKKNYIENMTSLINIKSTPASIPHEYALFLLSKEMKKNISVVLSGEGADEFFGGYSRVQKSPFDFEKVLLINKIKAKNLKEFLIKNLNLNFDFDKNEVNFYDFILSRYYWFSPSQKKNILSSDVNKKINNDFDLKASWKEILLNNNIENKYDRVLLMFQKKHLKCLLDRLDVMTMAASVEARVPFLDHELVEFINKVPFKYKIKWRSKFHKLLSVFKNSDHFSEKNDINKFLLRKLSMNYLPRSISFAKKLGFPLPMNKWVDVNEAKKILLDPKTLNRNLYDKKTISEILDEKKFENFDFSGKRIWMLLNVELWLREFFDK